MNWDPVGQFKQPCLWLVLIELPGSNLFGRHLSGRRSFGDITQPPGECQIL